MATSRNYAKEYKQYQGTATQLKRRAERNAARRKMVALGHVSKGDGKDVHHRSGNTSNNSRRNLAVLSKSKNRSMK
jgi:hypothetical protein